MKYKYIALQVGVLIIPLFAFAQQPVIDRMFVNEDSSYLFVWGDFGSVKGKIFVDSVEQPIVAWSDSLCVAAIPFGGKGSAGLVEIGARGYRSDGRMLTLIGIWHQNYTYDEDLKGPYSNTTNIYWYFRVDIESIFLSKTFGSRLHIKSSKLSSDRTIHYQSYKEDTSGGVGGGFPGDLNFTSKKIEVEFYNPNSFSLNKNFEPLAGSDHRLCGGKTHGICIDWGSLGYPFPPREKYLALGDKLSLSPVDSVYKDATLILLKWSKSIWNVKYHLQISTDSTFTNFVCDTLLDSTALRWNNADKGKDLYSRVCSVTDVGQSDWSNTSHASIKTTSSVSLEDKADGNSFLVIPNPATDLVHISSNVNLLNGHIFISDVLGKFQRYNISDIRENTLDISTLSPGNYHLVFEESGRILRSVRFLKK